MKKGVFVFLCMLLLVVAIPNLVFGDTWYGEDYGLGTVNQIRFFCDLSPNEINTECRMNVSSNKEIKILGLYVVDSDGNEEKWADGSIFSLDTNFNVTYIIKSLVFSNDVDVEYFKIKFLHPNDDYSTVYELKSTMRYDATPTPTPTNTPTPTPTNTPTPTPTNTPIPDPTNTPTPTPTNTPKPDPTNTPTPIPTNTPTPTPTNTPIPTPTSTPTPSPTPAPKLYLKAYVNDENQAVAEYETGGCTPVKSVIALYEVPDYESLNGSVLDQEVFISGAGIMKENMVEGKLYRYKLTYTYIRDGVQFTEFIWSQVLEIKDDYVYTGGIKNFRDLMHFIWMDLFSLKMRVEDKFTFSIKTYYIWLLLAGVLLCVFFKKLLD